MRLTRVHLPLPLEPGSVVELPRETAAHLARVLRARSGDRVVLFNGDGREYAGAIESVRGSRVCASVGAGMAVDRESPLPITLIQCVPRGDRMDFIVQKATELGVAHIVPVLSQRSVVRLDAAQAGSKAAHWRAIVVSACEQCGRNRLPDVEVPVPLVNFLGSESAVQTRWVLEPGAEPGTFQADAAPPAPAGTVGIAIGPEGGFAAEELEAFSLAGFARVLLGPRILRTETAAIAALTWLQTRWGDLSTA